MRNNSRIRITGIVQGVGFRPFIYKLAAKYNLKGFCLNDSQGVLIEVQGEMIEKFIQEIHTSPPPQSRIENIIITKVAGNVHFGDFRIRQSIFGNDSFVPISPDIAICHDCRKELLDPHDRRYLYPFINCTNCGPRYTIIKNTPYDRTSTTMASFAMCTECEKEYHDPANRRFHAQPNACHTCGPKIWLEVCGEKDARSEINTISDAGEVIHKAVMLLKNGAILAIKGLGGFHLACNASNNDAIKRLRERKRKSNKPFALMVPDIEAVKELCLVSNEEQTILEGNIRPIVLLKKIQPNPLPEAIATNNKHLGIMLPYTPLHHLLFCSEKTRFAALVMTSGNCADEPIIASHDEAIKKLSPIADYLLLHNRDIFMKIDDSIVISNVGNQLSGATVSARYPKSEIQIIRRARGFIPEPFMLGFEVDEILAFGADLKNTFCLTKGKYAVLSQHIGDLGNCEAVEFFHECLKNLTNSFHIEPRIIAHDFHPDYTSTRIAKEYAMNSHISEKNIVPVQHHHAHIVSCMAEHNLNDDVIGVAFDGTGYGLDGNIWGGEFLIANKHSFTRKAHLKYIQMPGADKAAKEPWRMATAYLFDTFGDNSTKICSFFFERLNPREIDTITKMLKKDINSPLTSSAGRLFDAVSSLLGLVDFNTFEGEAAIALEAIAEETNKHTIESYPFRIIAKEPMQIDLKPLIESLVEDSIHGLKTSAISLKFHVTLASIIRDVANIMRRENEINTVVLSGGVFQNRLLLQFAIKFLEHERFTVRFHKRIPTNDGGISLGQAVIAWEKLKNDMPCVSEYPEK